MPMSTTALNNTDRFTWLERPGDDFPYYRGVPVTISAPQWWLVMLGVAAGFAALIFLPLLLRGTGGGFVATILYWAIPLVMLAAVAGGAWTAIFRRLRGVDFMLMIGFALLNIAVTLVVGSIMLKLVETTASEAMHQAGALGGSDLLLFFVRTGIQLFGEEVMSILPFLALLYWLVGRGKMDRKAGIVVATLLTALIFAAAHLPTYGWSIPQTVMGVGVARIVLLLPYIMTKNIWVSTGAHIVNDWLMFGFSIFMAGNAPGTS